MFGYEALSSVCAIFASRNYSFKRPRECKRSFPEGISPEMLDAKQFIRMEKYFYT